MIVVLTLDSHNAQESTVHLDMPSLGLGWEDRVRVRDELTGAVFEWGAHNYVRLDPWSEPAHVLTVLEDPA